MPCQIDGTALKWRCSCPACSKWQTAQNEKKRKKRELDKKYYAEHFHSSRGCYCRKCIVKREKRRLYWQDHERPADSAHPKHYYYFRRKTNKDALVSLLGGKCAVCGFIPIHRVQIDIHESNGQILSRLPSNVYDGRFLPSHLLGTKKSFELLISHLHELVPLCKNCHILLLSKLKDNPEQKATIEAIIKEWRSHLDMEEIKRKLTATNLIIFQKLGRTNHDYRLEEQNRLAELGDGT